MVNAAQILDLGEQIARRFGPDRIILFGSYAYGTPTEDSDVDLLVIMPFDGKSREQRLEIWKQTRPAFPVDLLVRRPDDTERRYRERDPLIREALDRGKVIYEPHVPSHLQHPDEAERALCSRDAREGGDLCVRADGL